MSEALDKSLDKTSVPKVAPGIDLTKLPIGAREGFLLSRIDGRTSLGELASLCGFPADEVERLLARLIELRAAYVGDAVPWSSAPPEPEPAPKPAPTPEPPRAKPRPRVVRARRWEPAELDEVVELELEFKTRVLDLHTYLDDLDHYELLEVARDADRKAIKSAYYGLAAKFHTDRYFGRNLGTFKAKMEAIFSKITVAHDTLANKTRRTEYDEYLVDRDRTRAFERYLSGTDPYEAEAEAEAEPEPEPLTEPELTPAPAAEPPPSSSRPSLAPPVSDEQRLRREALARRLVGVSSSRLRGAPKAEPTAPPPPPAPPSVPSPADARAATEALKRRYQEGRDNARRTQARRLVDAANQALAKDDLLTAATNLRLALGYDEDPSLREHYEDVNRRAREVMAETYLKQARYEEQSSRWGPAAISYAKAHDGRPDDAAICERTANALRMEGRDLHKAARFAELAVQKSPTNVDFRITLGAVYLDAGLFLRARSELEQAAKIDPSHATLKDLLARARRMAS